MSNRNGRIFIQTIAGVTYGVSVADIQQTLGRGTSDVGLLLSDQEWYDNNGTQALRVVNKIKKWAWHKPIRHPSYGYDTHNLPAGDDGFNGQQPTGEYCIGSLEMPYAQTLGTITPSSNTEGGVTVTKWVASAGFLYNMMHGNIGWNYRRPRGVDNSHTEPLRMFDIAGYNHNSTSPMPIPPSGSRYISSNGQVTLMVDIPEDLPVGNMTLGTMALPAGLISTQPALSTFYAGILLYRPNFSDCVWKTATARIGTTTYQSSNKKVSFSSFKSIGVEGTAWNKMGTWYAKTFLSSVQLNEGDNPTAGENPLVFIMGSEDYTELNFTNGTITNDITIEVQRAKWIDVAEGNPSQIRVTATVRNGFVYDAAMSNIQMNVTSGLDTDPNPYDVTETSAWSGSEYATIPMLDEQSYSHVFSDVPYAVGRVTFASFSCRATVNGTTYNRSFMINLTPQASNTEVELI